MKSQQKRPKCFPFLKLYEKGFALKLIFHEENAEFSIKKIWGKLKVTLKWSVRSKRQNRV